MQRCWALGVDYPNSVASIAGRYQFKDDWELYGTMSTTFASDDAMICWEGKSCNGMQYYGRDRGAAIMGTTGTVVVDRGGYEIYDLKGKMTAEFKAGNKTASADLVGRDSMKATHVENLIAGHQ